MAKKGFRNSEPVSAEDKKKITKAGLKNTLFVFRYILPYKSYFIIGLLFLVLSSVTTMIFPFATGKLIDASLKKNNFFIHDINGIAFILIGVLLVQAGFSFMRIWLFSLVSERSMADMALLQDIISITLAEFLRQIVTLFVGIGIIFYTSPKLTLFMLGTFPILIVVAFVFGKQLRKISKSTQDKLAEANVVVEETFQAILMVKGFAI